MKNFLNSGNIFMFSNAAKFLSNVDSLVGVFIGFSFAAVAYLLLNLLV